LYTRGMTKQENFKSQMRNFVIHALYHVTCEHEGDQIDKGEVGYTQHK
jgi:transcription termination factor NusB